MIKMCYSAAVPLLIYGVLLALDIIDRSDANVAVLLIAESVAVVITIWATVNKYRGRRLHDRAGPHHP